MTDLYEIFFPKAERVPILDMNDNDIGDDEAATFKPVHVLYMGNVDGFEADAFSVLLRRDGLPFMVHKK